jgi:hypothetical protein
MIAIRNIKNSFDEIKCARRPPKAMMSDCGYHCLRCIRIGIHSTNKLKRNTRCYRNKCFSLKGIVIIRVSRKPGNEELQRRSCYDGRVFQSAKNSRAHLWVPESAKHLRSTSLHGSGLRKYGTLSMCCVDQSFLTINKLTNEQNTKYETSHDKHTHSLTHRAGPFRREARAGAPGVLWLC